MSILDGGAGLSVIVENVGLSLFSGKILFSLPLHHLSGVFCLLNTFSLDFAFLSLALLTPFNFSPEQQPTRYDLKSRGNIGS